MNYKEFIESKRHTSGQYGFEPVRMPEEIFDFQKSIVEKAIRKGRMGIFADTGLGKTRISLTIAKNIVEKTGGNVLILTPLAVAFQFIDEAKKIGIEDIEYSKEGEFTSKIVICNYERLDYFNSEDFEGVILDESSILKNFKGKIKTQVTSFLRKVKYRFLTTATPSPNDYIELGTSSEALGYMGYMDMLGKFFKNNQNDTGGNSNIGNKFYLKRHAEKSFFQWVNTRGLMIKKPSDLGFLDNKYELPPLIVNTNIVERKDKFVKNGQLFSMPEQSMTMTEVRDEQKATEKERCERAVELAKGKISVYRCNTNSESATLKELDPEAVEIIGSQSIERKEEILKGFANGKHKRIITKAKMTGMGLNRQHCNHCVFFPTWSYEQYYQAIRRFWRFGQESEVVVDLVISDGQKRVIKTLETKIKKAQDLYVKLVDNVNSNFEFDVKEENHQIEMPLFMK